MVACLGQGSLGEASCTCPCGVASLVHRGQVLACQGAVGNLDEGILACQQDHWAAADQDQAAAAVQALMVVCLTATAAETGECWSLSWSWKVTVESWDPAWDCWPLLSGVVTSPG